MVKLQNVKTGKGKPLVVLNETWTIKPGEPCVSRFRSVAFDGKSDMTQFEQIWKDYAKDGGDSR